MLVLSRKPGEKLVIGSGVTVTVLEVQGNRVRVGIDAPAHIRILREELACWQEPAEGRDGQLDPTPEAEFA
ncbi:MAG TPA: carbon storage regulator [Gemmataceae bacterium]|nr:carbon storage regulator [Gemmataceae bacterium]